MKTFTARIFIIRFLELLFSNAIISSMVTALNLMELMITQESLYVGTLIGTVVFVLVNVRMMRHCYTDIQDKEIYYTANLLACIAFAIVSVIIYLTGAKTLFSLLFATAKMVRTIDMEIGMKYSLLLFHTISTVSVFIAPIGIKPDYSFYDESDEEIV